MARKKNTGLFPRLERGTLRTLIIIIGILVIIRIALPFIILHYANKTLATNIRGYYGHIQDVDLSLIRGAYQLDNIYINKVDTLTNYQTSFFRSDVIDLSLEWKALLHGKIAGKIRFNRPELRFTKDKVEPNQVVSDSSDFRKTLKQFMPLDVNKFEVNNGLIEYRDSTSSPVVNLKMEQLYVLAQNLKNSYRENEVLPASIVMKSYLYGGHMSMDMKLNPLAEFPQYDMNAEITNTNLVDFNNFFKAYGKFDVSRGTFGMYTEMASADGKFKGYVKPLIKDLKVLGPEDKNDNIFHKAWEAVVGAVGMVFRNWPENQLATKVPIEGSYNDPKPNILEAIIEVLKNAFIQALMPSIDREISLAAVGKRVPKDQEKDAGDMLKLYKQEKKNK